jgi:hypothetical protein
MLASNQERSVVTPLEDPGFALAEYEVAEAQVE